MLPDAPERIRAHHADSSPTTNMKLLRDRTYEQGPTRMHLLRDALIADGTVLTRSAFDRIAPAPSRLAIHGEPDSVKEAALCSTYVTTKYFGHWLKDGRAHEELATETGTPPLVLDQAPWMHEQSYRALLSSNVRRASLAWCEQLWVLEDHEFNSHWVRRYRKVRERLRAAVGAPARGSTRVFLSRGVAGTGRILANEREVRKTLARRGFEIIAPEELDAKEVATKLAAAKLVVAAEGSALAHAAIALPRGSGMLAIMGAQHFNMTYKGLCDALGFKFGLTIATAIDEQSFRQPLGRLLRAVDLLDEAVENG